MVFYMDAHLYSICIPWATDCGRSLLNHEVFQSCQGCPGLYQLTKHTLELTTKGDCKWEKLSCQWWRIMAEILNLMFRGHQLIFWDFTLYKSIQRKWSFFTTMLGCLGCLALNVDVQSCLADVVQYTHNVHPSSSPHPDDTMLTLHNHKITQVYWKEKC